MASDQKENYWYSQTLMCCFPDDGVSDVSFLLVFASISCAPGNKNYGKKKEDRRRGAANADSRRQQGEIQKDQEKLLEQFNSFLDNWSSVKETTKLRMSDLASDLVNKFLDLERGYTQKNSNYKPGDYRSFYCCNSQADAVVNFHRMCCYYAKALEAIFGHGVPDLEQRYEGLKELLSQELPQYQPEETGNTIQDMGKYLAIALMCAAGKEGYECACRILEIELPEREATLSVISPDKVTLKIAQFNRICAAALRADMVLEELQAVQQILESIWKQTDGNPDGETRMLVEALEVATQKCLERLTDALVKNRARDGSNILTEEITAVNDIRNKCWEWMS